MCHASLNFSRNKYWQYHLISKHEHTHMSHSVLVVSETYLQDNLSLWFSNEKQAEVTPQTERSWSWSWLGSVWVSVPLLPGILSEVVPLLLLSPSASWLSHRHHQGFSTEVPPAPSPQCPPTWDAALVQGGVWGVTAPQLQGRCPSDWCPPSLLPATPAKSGRTVGSWPRARACDLQEKLDFYTFLTPWARLWGPPWWRAGGGPWQRLETNERFQYGFLWGEAFTQVCLRNVTLL